MKGDDDNTPAAAVEPRPSSPGSGSEKQHPQPHDEELGCKPASSHAAGTSSESTQRGLKSRHAQMIALGGSIGTGLFVGSGQGLRMGGPALLLACYAIITLLLYGVAAGVGEVSAYLPVRGSGVAYYGHRFVSRSLGFTLGWLYWYIFSLGIAGEITITTIVIQYWPSPVPTAAWYTLIAVVIVACNFFPVAVYGEAEFWFASTKVIAIIGLLILTVVLFFGGGPAHEPLYFSNWTAGAGPVNTYLVDGGVGRLCAFVGTLTFSVYAFIFAPEMLVATAGEMQSPRRNMPRATKRYFWRLVVFYLLGVLAIGVLVRGDNPGLLSPGNTAAASPWALGIKEAGIPVLDSVINAVIVLSAWSTGNSFLYISSRALYSLALSGNAPRIFARCTRHGIPHYATALSACFAALAYMNLGSTGSVVFNWLVNIVNTGAFQSWICCCFIYVRFYKATRLQNVTVANGQLPYRSRFQPYAAWISGVVFAVLLLLNGFKVFVKGYWDTPTFITSYIGIVIFAVLFLGHKFTIGRNDPWMVPLDEMDLHSGMDDVMAAELPPPPPIKWYTAWRVLFE
ncbi:Amino acid/polyamine transporter I [Cordyceps fumosorosea ARSEF 2679]|uniref:Amino acid/polyamine transporter I n=1 Tax=Cordyceps fumosorosea (strain ARSEF 2679) TaxID=1081104 RepID=A0A167XFP5_CORFA|nr:Amino acid/polyamine transporter I [Cordyceps fumosorosea ARSEF 2679]OAA64924.1 Amino acid/polyamine transporter I [Cordyceps fumosorosea ARSEF 2679]